MALTSNQRKATRNVVFCGTGTNHSLNLVQQRYQFTIVTFKKANTSLYSNAFQYSGDTKAT